MLNSLITADQGPVRKALQHPEDLEHVDRLLLLGNPGSRGTVLGLTQPKIPKKTKKRPKTVIYFCIQT